MEDLRKYINHLRHDFSRATLDESMVHNDPILQFEMWFREAVEAKVNEPNAMTLATVGRDMRPSARILLLRNFSEKGFVFYTNYESEKGKDLNENPFCCLNFFWPELERQVRIEGKVIKQEKEESDRYFNARPLSSRLGAWTSPQSKVIADRKWLEDELKKNEAEFSGEEVVRPEWWGGYTLVPDTIEFWQGRESRLHDRIRYVCTNVSWKIERLAP